jgi:prepilin-type N-terminal cleavage/methylation domain-containing protein/prepilin-type processing-associated H-X9-DG protein
MNRVDSKKAIQAFTLLESAVVLAALAIIAMFVVFPMLSNRRTYKGYCVNNLKNVGLAFRTAAVDSGVFPFRLSEDVGGTAPYAQDPVELWRHFTVLSNEVSTKVLSCPKDTRKATSFDWQSVITNDHNRAISYTLGLDATEEEPQSILSSDRNLTLDGLPVGVAILTLRSNSPVGFHTNLHNLAGNVLFGDGSVQQVTSGRLTQMVTNAVGSSNSRNIRIVVP